MIDEKDISKLLRLKRYEQPPPGYFEDFLHEFQARQRDELLRQPLWRIGLERIGAFFSDHAAGRLAYGGAALAVLAIAAVVTFGPFAGSNLDQNLVADTAPSKESTVSMTAYEGPAALPVAKVGRVPADAWMTENARLASPHYVIDARPVSYERPSF